MADGTKAIRLKVTLADAEPAVWRRLLVAETATVAYSVVFARGPVERTRRPARSSLVCTVGIRS